MQRRRRLQLPEFARYSCSQFMLKHLNIFEVRADDGILLVMPKVDAGSFRYQELHREANSIRDQLMKPSIEHLVLNLSRLEYFGSEFIGSLVSMAREVRNRRGQAVICEANPLMHDVLKNMSLLKLWPYFETEAEAVQHLRAIQAARPAPPPA
jgi:anti-anti-sigma factor